MLEKNKEKEKRKQRKTWCGYYSRYTPSKIEKVRKIERKENQKKKDEEI